MSRKLLTKKEFNEIYSKVPRICVDIIIIKNRKILLTKRSIPPFKGFWHIPGGSVLYRERVKKAISRIAKKELGIDVKPIKFLGYSEMLKDGPKRHSITLEFICKIKTNKKLKVFTDASEYNFFDELPKRMVYDQKIFLRRNGKKLFNKN